MHGSDTRLRLGSFPIARARHCCNIALTLKEGLGMPEQEHAAPGADEIICGSPKEARPWRK
jgi:hypothetical protein